ncbi:MAG TPA: hypothetical protein VGD80_07855 [Kofleriaceae bacterium]
MTARTAADTECVERVAAKVDGGLGVAAIAAITAVPAGPAREAEISIWARRIAADSAVTAFVLPPDITDDEIEIIAQLYQRVQLERGQPDEFVHIELLHVAGGTP